MKYQPISLQDPYIVNWPKDLEEILFVSSNSILMRETIQD